MSKQITVIGRVLDVKRRKDGWVKYHVSHPDAKGNIHNVWTNWMTDQNIAAGDDVQVQVISRNSNIAEFNHVAQHKENQAKIALIASACGFAAGCAVCLAIGTFTIVREIKPTIKLVNNSAQKILHKLNK